jgi:lipopolysaccharide export system protein LptA
VNARAAIGGLLLALVLPWPLGAAAQGTRSGSSDGQAPSRTPTSATQKKTDDRRPPVTVDADKMERFGKESLVVFTGNVVARQDNSVQYADRLEVYLDEKGNRILRTVSRGNVRVVTKDCKTATAQRMEYFELQKLVRLIGDARVWEEDNVVSGDTIDMYLSEDRSVVQAGTQGRVKAQFFAKDEQQGERNPTKTAGRPSLPCKN